jgi:hypothetical protein
MAWDWRGQPDLDELDRIVANMSAVPLGMIRVHQANTGNDQYGIVVTDEELTPAQVNERWRAWWTSER